MDDNATASAPGSDDGPGPGRTDEPTADGTAGGQTETGRDEHGHRAEDGDGSAAGEAAPGSGAADGSRKPEGADDVPPSGGQQQTPEQPDTPTMVVDGEDGLSAAERRRSTTQRDQRRAGFDAGTYIGAVYVNDSEAISFGGTGRGAGTPPPGQVDPARLNRELRRYRSAPSDTALAEVLANHRIAFLTGAAFSGRASSACAALAEWTRTRAGGSRVTVLHAATEFGALPRRMSEGSGHLLDATGLAWPDALAHADLDTVHTWLAEHRSTLVVLIDDPEPSEAIRPYLVAHRTPDLDAVLLAYLDESLDSAGRAALDYARPFPSVQAWRAEMATPAEAVELAAVLAEWWSGGSAAAGRAPALAERRHRLLCGQARRLLSAAHNTDSPTQQGYVLATAVLDGHAASTVIRAAGRLIGHLRTTENPEDALGREVFSDFLRRRMRHVRTTTQEGADPPGGVAPPQVVRLLQPRLAGALLDVVWAEFDAARDPLLTWLRELCEDHDTRVRISSAQALGRLAGLDYPEIKRRVIVPLADSSRPVHHQAASWLLEKAYKDGTRETEVRGLLRKWARSGKWSQVAVALRGYTTDIAAEQPEEALRSIREFMLDPRLRLRDVDVAYLKAQPTRDDRFEAEKEIRRRLLDGFGRLVPTALAELYAAGRCEDVLKELITWTRLEFRARMGVADAFLRIALIPAESGGAERSSAAGPAEPGAPERYDLLVRLADGRLGAVAAADVAGLWRRALLDARLYGYAWEFLSLWDDSAAPESPEHSAFEELLKYLGTDPDLRRRLALYHQLRAHRGRGQTPRPTSVER
ncbi:ICP22 family protein [Streptomonospora litoralis]|uniref:Uncharacterized protein n=1 Tax=Streptomonospora litoralis TaxID=2498135 RepID=A0A4P6Q465_9ACTN|nr:hypothetical protein [Streptomonospora litoralis]QBI53614.1 hypothetical protein EKD16_09100 [Streptomonospora litoralis]